MTAPEPVTREALMETLGQARKTYREALAKDRAQATGRLHSERLELSKAMHEAYRRGLPKVLIRRAIKTYNNTGEFQELWDLYDPEDGA